MHTAGPKGKPHIDSEENILILGWLIYPQVCHQTGYSKHVGGMGVCQAVFNK